MSRVLALPAVLCLALGVVLGVWGWGARDEARARIIPEVDDRGGLFDIGPPVDVARVDQTCGVLRAASRVELPDLGAFGLGPPGATSFGNPTPSTVAPSSAELAAALVSVLNPEIIYGLPELDRMDVYLAIARERDAVEVVQQADGDVRTDAGVLAAAQELGGALDGTC